MSARFPQGLEAYVPSSAMPHLEGLKFPVPFRLDLTRGRNSKLGDHRPPGKGISHRITVNYDLGPYSFLITLIHELAHMLAFEEYGQRIAPHGPEWKATFQRLMAPFVNESIFPPPLTAVLRDHMEDPKASLYADAELLKALRDLEDPDGVSLEELPKGSRFMLDKGWVMEKGKKLRTRYRCLHVGTSRIYLVNGSARVEPMEGKKA